MLGIFKDLENHWRDSRWIAAHNRYRYRTTHRVTRDCNRSALRHRELGEYIAASIVGHCFDGWSFLSRAVEAELAGDPRSAKHLAYYAELRAAMSILAGEGVGVFHRRHVIVTHSGRCVPATTQDGTHQFLWDALEHWSQSSAGTTRMLDVIRPANIPLAQWTHLFGGAAGFVARDWLLRWGLDLSRLAKDRESRNVASYRPRLAPMSGPRQIGDVVQNLLNWWSACEPGASGGFPIIDRHLLRGTLVLLFKTTTQTTRIRRSRHYAKRVRLTLNGLSLADPQRDSLEAFLTFESSDSRPLPLMLAAAGKLPHSHIQHSQQVLARATLLLRVSTGCLTDALRRSGLSIYKDLEFWWSNDAVRRRIWSPLSPPDSFVDLWGDIDEALEDLRIWQQRSPIQDSYADFWKTNAVAATVLPTLERAFLWGAA